MLIANPQDNTALPDMAALLTAEYCAAVSAHNAAMRAYRAARDLYAPGSPELRAAAAARNAAHLALGAAYDLALAAAPKA